MAEQIDVLQRGQANDLLSQMNGDVSTDRATKESIDLACKMKDALAAF